MKVTDSIVSVDRIEDVSISQRHYGRPVDDRTSMSRLSPVVSCDWAWIGLKLHISHGRGERMNCQNDRGSRLTHASNSLREVTGICYAVNFHRVSVLEQLQ